MLVKTGFIQTIKCSLVSFMSGLLGDWSLRSVSFRPQMYMLRGQPKGKYVNEQVVFIDRKADEIIPLVVYTLRKDPRAQSTVYLHLRQLCAYLHFTVMYKVS